MKNLLEELTERVKRNGRFEDVEEENDMYFLSYSLRIKEKGEWGVSPYKNTEFLDLLKTINFNSKKELFEKIKPYFEDFSIKTRNFVYEINTDLEDEEAVIGWQWKAL